MWACVIIIIIPLGQDMLSVQLPSAAQPLPAILSDYKHHDWNDHHHFHNNHHHIDHLNSNSLSSRRGRMGSYERRQLQMLVW
jgi:hypothetical protein